jgi:hypothetical protein
MKHDWKKEEKAFYAPKNKPEQVHLPSMNFFSIRGEGNPNHPAFAEYIGVLYSLSYAVKMSPKSEHAPIGYFEYSVYPLEGLWDITDEAKQKPMETLDKDALTFNLMIRQPDFVTTAYASAIIEQVKKKKPHPLLDKVRFETIEEGNCVQILHLGSYDNEAQSFATMEAFAQHQGLVRKYKTHREIYLSDARKTAADKLKTILRFQV